MMYELPETTSRKRKEIDHNDGNGDNYDDNGNEENDDMEEWATQTYLKKICFCFIVFFFIIVLYRAGLFVIRFNYRSSC